jgi:hypothetical protein
MQRQMIDLGVVRSQGLADLGKALVGFSPP